jgi:hypothetical protein
MEARKLARCLDDIVLVTLTAQGSILCDFLLLRQAAEPLARVDQRHESFVWNNPSWWCGNGDRHRSQSNIPAWTPSGSRWSALRRIPEALLENVGWPANP